MSMPSIIPNRKSGLLRLLAFAMVTALPGMGWLTHLTAQSPLPGTTHYLNNYGMPPGEVALRKTLARQSMVGYFQPVRFVGPGNTEVAVFSEGAFQHTSADNQIAGLMVGHVYRLKVTNIPGYPGKELYPSVEMIGRLFPPQPQATLFPIPIHIELDDLEPAMQGALVTRVVYLENPRTAIPEQRGRNDQPFFDVGTAQDPLLEAERFGRPMAIVRIGSRIPDNSELNAFGFGTPPMKWYQTPPGLPAAPGETGEPTAARQPGESTGAQRIQQVAHSQVHSPQSSRPSHTIGESTTADSNRPPYPALPVASTDSQQWTLSDAGVTGPEVSPSPMQFSSAATSVSVDGCQDCPPGSMSGAAYPAQLDCTVPLQPGDAYFLQAQPMLQPAPWPDELLIDGGDRNFQARVKELEERWEIRHLDTEDTIAHFQTRDGRRIVDKSNRVAIYAPRFSAVRKLDNLGRTQFTNLVGRVEDEFAPSSSQFTDISSTTLQNLQPTRHTRLTQAVGMENQTRGVRIENVSPTRMFQSNFKTFENLRLVKSGFLDNREKGRLSIAIQRAVAWESDVSAQSTNDKLEVIVVKDVRSAEETIHVKTELGRPQIRLVKIASVDSAHPGDVVDFTIRFDNVGNEAIGNVTIMDNLTGRLGYVEGTAECSLPSQFITEANDAGSLILRWEITDPLPATQGGVIRFQCRVR